MTSHGSPSAEVEDRAPELCCPVCKSDRFIAFNGRENARCAGCGCVERNRLLWMILDRLGLFRPGLRVLHFAPEMALARRLVQLCGDRYHACDIDPARYGTRFVQVRPFDLCTDLVKLPSRSFDLVLHSHVLEHLQTDVEQVLGELERITAPGGHHLLSVPIRGEETREDLSDDLSPTHRAMMFGQDDHYRIFGTRSLTELLARVWGGEEEHLITPEEMFGADALTRAAVPPEAWQGITSHSIFHHRRPLQSRIEIAAAEAPALAAPEERPAVQGASRLILHIGMPKTGTSSLQRWLKTQGPALAAAGVATWPDAENQSEVMFTAFASAERIARGRMWFQKGAGLEAGREAALAEVAAFVEGLNGGSGVISAEALWTFTRAEIAGLAEALAGMGSTAEILCWVRPPMEYFTSAAQQRSRGTLATEDIGLGIEREIPLSYERLDGWIEAFGAGRVHVRAYQGDAVDALAEALADLGIAIAPAAGAPGLNRSISLQAAKALLALNQARRGRPAAKGARSELMGKLLAGLEGDRFALPESLLRRLKERFQREAGYLQGRFGVAPESGVDAVDDAGFYGWTSAEVGQLLAAIDDALIALEAKSQD